ncbi:hypothetical protein [Enterococcus casseliflavus]|uniref:hypothetical protein n=1 Tax=Enterococcus casseliflavus TaxID=37734 RepID=UPI003D6B4DC9
MKKELLDFIEEEKVLDANPKMEMVPAKLLEKKVKDLYLFEKSAQDDLIEWIQENGSELSETIQGVLDTWKVIHNIPATTEPNTALAIDSVDVDSLTDDILNAVKKGIFNVINTRQI